MDFHFRARGAAALAPPCSPNRFRFPGGRRGGAFGMLSLGFHVPLVPFLLCHGWEGGRAETGKADIAESPQLLPQPPAGCLAKGSLPCWQEEVKLLEKGRNFPFHSSFCIAFAKPCPIHLKRDVPIVELLKVSHHSQLIIPPSQLVEPKLWSYP